MSSRIFSLPVALVLTLLAGCASAPPIDRTEPLPEESAQTLTADNFAADIAPDAAPLPSWKDGINVDGEDSRSFEPPKPEIQVGTGKFIDEEAARRPIPAPGGEGQVDFNFENNPIQAVVKAILGDLLQQNYTIAPNVGGNVSFSTAKPIRADQAMSVLEMLLSWTGNTLIYKDGRYTVLQIKDALPGNLTPRISSPKLALGYEVRVYPLRYVSPSEMAKLLKPYAKPEAFINIDTARSMLVLAGTASELANYAQTIEIFDVDWLKGMSIGVFTLQNVEVATLMPELDKVFGVAGESPLAGMFRFIPIERSNAVIAITAQPEYLRKAEEWLRRLDHAGGESATQLFVYDVKNIKSLDLADYLNQIFLGSASNGGSGRSDTSGSVAPGLAAASIGAAASVGAAAAKASNPLTSSSRLSSRLGGGGADGSRARATGAAVAAIASDSSIRITAVEESNQLLVLATPIEWETMQGAIRRLDIAPLQVHIETKILEVSLTGNLEYGVKWWFAGLAGSSETGYGGSYQNSQGVDYPNPLDRQRSLAGAIAQPVAAGSNLFASYLNSKFQVALSALQTSGQAKILSAPSLMVMNNQEAQINVGTRIPVSTTSIVGVGGAVNGSNQTVQSGVSQTSYLDTGVILTVKPRVNPGGLVYMEVAQEVSKPGPTDSATGNPPINTRTLDTSIAVQSGDTILLGGLISEDDQTSEDGVPGLSRIPVIGKLFGSTTTSNQRTELIVLITPQVMANSDEARAITEEYKNQFQSLAPLRKEMEGSKPHNNDSQQ